jgi:ubiquinone/menaquinone biosynthesis C-methylase UbiE
MHNHQQKKYFLEEEANRWYERNLEKIRSYDRSGDEIISLLKKYNTPFSSVLEIGCSEGYRLDGILQEFGNLKACGVDPSLKALEAGRKKYTSINLHYGTADNLDMFEDASFDVLIMGFVLYVVDRGLLLKAMSEADRVLKNNGTLVILDFFSEKATRRKYHHISEIEAYSYKQRYDEMFTATKLYHLLHRSTYDHTTMKENSAATFQELVSLSVLKKDIEASYK